MTKLRILTLLARYGASSYAGADEKIERLFSQAVPGVEHRMLIVDNALPTGHAERVSLTKDLIGGDPAFREFSGFDEGLRRLGAGALGYDVLHLATAAYDQYYTRYIERFDEDTLRLVAGHGVVVGHVDAYGAPVAAYGVESQYWIRSSWVLIAPSELLLLGPLAFARREPLFSGDPARPFRDDAPISPGYVKLISDWLTSSEGTGQGTAWHSRFDVSPETLRLFEDKTLAIINEHMLTVRLRAQGTRVLDQTWLAGHRTACLPLPAVWPAWREQLAARDDVPVRPGPSRLPC